MKRDEKERKNKGGRRKERGKKWGEELVKKRNVISKNNKNKKHTLIAKPEESKNLKKTKKVSKEQIVKNKQK